MESKPMLYEPPSVTMEQWTLMRQQADLLVKTGFLPSAIKTPEQAVAIMLKGRELRIPAMYALSNIVVIQGKPAANAELMLALIYRDHGSNAMSITESTTAKATIVFQRTGWPSPHTYSFTIDDAKRAGLLDGGNAHSWQKYPQAMLRARCISAVARMAFPDIIGGLYTPEELEAPIVARDDGTIEVLTDLPNEPSPALQRANAQFDKPPVVTGHAPPLTGPQDFTKLAEAYGIQPSHLANGVNVAYKKTWRDLTINERMDVTRRCAIVFWCRELTDEQVKGTLAFIFLGDVNKALSLWELEAEQVLFLYDAHREDWVHWFTSGQARADWAGK